MMNWFFNLLFLSIKVTPIIVLLLLLNPVLKRRYSAKWLYILWVAVSLRLLLPFSFQYQIPASFKVPISATERLISSAPVAEHISKINLINITDISKTGVGIGEIFCVIYLAGAIICLTHEVVSYIGFKRNVLRWSSKPLNDEIKAILEVEKQRLKIKQNISVIISKKVYSPMLIGLFKPKLVLPSDIYPIAELKMILSHELVHLKRHDIWFKAILMAVAFIHWFNPAVYFMVKQANKDIEQSCDDCVLKEADVEEKKFYCRLFLKMAIANNEEEPIFTTNIVSNKENLELRIKNIFDNKKKKPGILMQAAVMLLLIVSGTIIVVGGSEQALEQEENLSFQRNSFNEFNGIINENVDYNIFNELKHKVGKVNDSDSKDISVNNEYISTKAKNSDIITAKTQEKNIAIDDKAEIVIVDLDQLENNEDESYKPEN